MTLIHTSPAKIEKIEKDYGTGIFEDVLFFSRNGYVHTGAETVFEYHVEVEEDEIISAYNLDNYEDEKEYKDAIKELSESYSFVDEENAGQLICDEVKAQDLLDEEAAFCINQSGRNVGEELGNLDWTVQKIQAQLALAFGYRFAESRDENGHVWMGAMYGRETELVLFEE